MKNKDVLELKEFERKQDIYERISKVSGIGNRRKLNPTNLVLEKQESSLRDIVEKNVCKGLNKNAKPRNDLIKNFHWLIKRYRRMKKLTTKQFADAIREPEKVVVLAEQGIVPEGYEFIKKIERFLGIALIKTEVYEDLRQKEQTRVNFENLSESELTIADLKELKEKEKIKGGFFGFFSSKKEERFIPESSFEEKLEFEEPKELNLKENSRDSNFSQKKELSREEMDDLIFGRK